jgi:hypothetical protein
MAEQGMNYLKDIKTSATITIWFVPVVEELLTILILLMMK